MMRFNTNNLIFYSLIGITILFIFISNPFLKLPYDMWEHLNRIVSLHDDGTCFEFYPERSSYMCFWHSIWANIFKITGINDIFAWAKIIHIFQFLLAFAAIYYFCKTTIKILLKDIELIHLKYLSLIGSLLWFIGNGTFSVAYQQAWIMWYSINYQGLAIPLFWYITALILKLTYEDQTLKRILFYLIQVAIISVIIAKTHPTELLYFVINVLVLFLLNLKKFFPLFKKYYFLIIPFILAIIIAIIYFTKELIPSFILPTSIENLRIIYQDILRAGSRVVEGGLNRLTNSFSEIAIVSIILAVLFRGFYKKNKIGINIKGFDYILATSLLFFVIPINKITAGIAAYFVTLPEVVWRFFFGSPWFVFLPLLVYITFKYFSKKQILIKAMLASIAVILVFVVLSKYIFSGVLYKNAESIVLSINKSRVGIQYSEKDIALLKEVIIKHEPVHGDKPNIYYIRGDLGPIMRGVLRKYVYMHEKRDPLPGKDSFFAKGLDRKYNLVDINLPEDFPKDEGIFRYFPIDKI